jgi:Asp-tRNA(Asn)/Glu-tRNA(Gln) amidotransferase A subunit family amidase
MRTASNLRRPAPDSRITLTVALLTALASACGQSSPSRPWIEADQVLAESLALSSKPAPRKHASRFHLLEASIDDIHRAIQEKEVTCREIVEAYVARAAAYNGPCTQLVTADGAPIAASEGYVRAGAPIRYPTSTVPVSSMLPNLDQYVGPPIDLGRMQASAAEPSIVEQIGIVTGIPQAGQVNALETLNIRGERSITCRGDYDKLPSAGDLPAGAPAACEAFRQQPDALERATELDAQYGSQPDLKRLPMYCVTFSVKNWYDAKDMHSSGGNDVDFAMDAPPADSTLVARLRAKGAIIYAKSIASQVGNTGSGPATATKLFVPSTDNARATWGGTACTPYDTERSPGFSSGGAGASVAANLVTCGICETTGGSCRIPANPNNVTSLVTTKGLISSDRGWTAQHVNHRPGVLCRSLKDSALVLDALKDPSKGYFDSNDMFTALPKGLISKKPYASYLVGDDDLKKQPEILAGTRVGVVREFMIKPNPNNVAISDLIDAEIKNVLRDKLGATLIESMDPLYPDDPTIPNMTYTFQDGFSEIVGLNAPEYFFQTAGTALEFAVPGYDVTSKDYLVKLALRQAPLSDNLNLRRVTSGLDNALRTPFLMDRYLLQRGDAKVKDWASFVANATWFADTLRAGSENIATLNTQDIRATSGIDRLKMVTIARMVVGKVMLENDLDVMVIPNIPAPVERNEFARDPVTKDVRPNGPSITDLLGVPEVIVPAGYNQVVYEAQYVLSADKKSYVAVAGTVQSLLPRPLPISMMFFSGPGEEPAVLKVASAYESATHHRVPPPDFGPLPGEP